MRRRFFNAVCLLSLVLAVAVAALWARSVWWAEDWLGCSYGTCVVIGVSQGGCLYVVAYRDPASKNGMLWRQEPPDEPLVWLPRLRLSGFFNIRLPYWMPLVGLSVPQAL